MKIGFTCGTFDLLHAGHVAMLEWCKDHCDKLIVGLQYDPSIDRAEKNKPVQSIVERTMQLRACKFVDEVIVYTTEAELLDLLGLLKFDVRFLGVEYRDKDFTGRAECLEREIELKFNPRGHKFSSSELRSRVSH
jgi:glycerol-3-phosphate cytidylyltransferase